MAYTIYDIARLANVSKSTVSRVLNNQSNISEGAKQRVLKAIKDLNYQPNKLAQALSSSLDAIMIISRPTNTTIDNPFFSDIIQSICIKAEEENFDVILQTAKDSNDELEKCSKKIKSKIIRGIIMLSSPNDETLFKKLDEFNIPIVVIGKVEGTFSNIYSVDTDNYMDSYNLTQYLIKKEHTDIACLHSPLEYHVAIDRLNGYRDCMKKNQIPLNPLFLVDCGYSLQSTYHAIENLFSRSPLPTAVFATDDLKVAALIQLASEKRMDITKKITLVGYCNPSLFLFLSSSFVHIEIPVKKLAETATKVLFSVLSGKDLKKRFIVPTIKVAKI